MKKIVFTLLSIFMSCFTVSGTVKNGNSSQDDTTRLQDLYKLAILQQSTTEGLSTAHKLYREAVRLNSDTFKCHGAYLPLLYYFNHDIQDSIRHYADLTKQLAEKSKLWSVYFDAENLQIRSYIANQEFEYSIDKSYEMLGKAKEIDYPEGIVSAYLGLASAYVSTERMEEGMNILLIAYKELPRLTDQLTVINLLNLLIATSRYMENYDHQLIYLNEMDEAIAKHLTKHPFSDSYNSVYLFSDIYHASYHIHKGSPELAWRYLKKAEKYKDTPYFTVYKGLYYDVVSDYYFLLKAYNQAVAAIDSSMLNLKSVMPKDYYRQLNKKANILSKAEQYAEALKLYQESLHGKDSIDQALSKKQIEQIQEFYNVNKLLWEQEQIKHYRQLTALVVIMVILTLLSIFIARALSLRKKLKESEKQMREASQMAENANEVKNLFLSNMSYNIRTPLNNVVGFSQLMAIDPGMDESQRKEYSAIIKANSEKLLNLVNDVLDLSRLEAGMMKFNLQDYDAITLCREAMYSVKGKNQPIHVDFQSEIEEQIIHVDLFRFSQLLFSVLTYPTTTGEERNISLTVELDEPKQFIRFKTTGSPIADPKLATQEVTIRNDINNLFLKRFGGTYQVSPVTPEGPVIIFAYPLSISE